MKKILSLFLCMNILCGYCKAQGSDAVKPQEVKIVKEKTETTDNDFSALVFETSTVLPTYGLKFVPLKSLGVYAMLGAGGDDYDSYLTWSTGLSYRLNGSLYGQTGFGATRSEYFEESLYYLELGLLARLSDLSLSFSLIPYSDEMALRFGGGINF